MHVVLCRDITGASLVCCNGMGCWLPGQGSHWFMLEPLPGSHAHSFQRYCAACLLDTADPGMHLLAPAASRACNQACWQVETTALVWGGAQPFVGLYPELFGTRCSSAA